MNDRRMIAEPSMSIRAPRARPRIGRDRRGKELRAERVYTALLSSYSKKTEPNRPAFAHTHARRRPKRTVRTVSNQRRKEHAAMTDDELQALVGPTVWNDSTPLDRQMIQRGADENPAGVKRLATYAAGHKSITKPAAWLRTMIAKGDHHRDPAAEKRQARNADQVEVAVARYHARNEAYPPTDQKGWSEEDAVFYAVDSTIQTTPGPLQSRELETQLRKRVGAKPMEPIASVNERRRWITVQRRLPGSPEARAELHRLLDLGAPGNAILKALEKILGGASVEGINPNEPVGTTLLPTIDAAIAKTRSAVAEDDLAALFAASTR